MSLSASWVDIPVVYAGTYYPSKEKLAGKRIVVEPLSLIVADDEAAVPKRYTFELDANGELTGATLPSTTNGDVGGVYYRVTEKWTGARDPFNILVLANAAEVNLATEAPVVDADLDLVSVLGLPAVVAAQAAQAAAEDAQAGAESAQAAAQAAAASAASDVQATLAAAVTAASDSETAAAGSATSASDAQTAAQAAQAAAEIARDAAQAGANVYASTAAGLAAVAEGGQFMVVVGDEIVRYEDVGGVATERARYPSASALAAPVATIGTILTPVEAVFGTIVPNTSNAATTFFWSPMLAAFEKNGRLKSVRIRMSAAGTAKLLVVDEAGYVRVDQDIVAVAAGVHTESVDIPVTAGSRVYMRTTAGGALRYDSPGGTQCLYFAATEYSGSVGDTIPVSAILGNTPAFAIELTVQYAVDDLTTRADDSDALVEGIRNAVQEAFTARPEPTATWAIGAPNFGWIEVAFDAGTDLDVGSSITAVEANMGPAADAHHFTVLVSRRLTSAGDVRANYATDEIISSGYLSLAEVGLTAGGSNAKGTFPVSPFVVEAGYTYHALIRCYKSPTGIPQSAFFSQGYTTTAVTRQRRRGWYASGLSSAASLVGAGFLPAVGFAGRRASLDEILFADTVVNATATVSGFSVTAMLRIDRNGADLRGVTTQTFTAAAAGKARYDVLYFDAVAQTFGVAAGTEATNDPSERIPAMTSASRVPLFNVRVSDTAVEAVPVWYLRDGGAADIVASIEAERRRSRRMIPKTLGKLSRGAPIHIVSVGDSIVAHQWSGTPSTATPNGPYRDRAADVYLAEKIGADLIAAIPRYTAAGLGRAADAAGAVYTKFGLVWELVAALEAFGSTVTYDNFCIASKKSSDVATGGSLTAWGSAVVALAPDLLVVHFGMNELNQTTTQDNLVKLIQSAQAVGTEVVLMGVPRRRDTQVGWEYTNRAILRAARFTNAAHVPTVPIYDARYIGAVGCSTVDVCSANGINHPGINEHKMIGRQLARLLVP